MAHIHSVKDTDVHYKIDGITRTIVNVNETKRMLVQNDHNSERLTFEVPRYVDGHDLTTCNVVQVHYMNSDTYEEKFSSGVYEVNDLGIKGASGDDANIVVLSWLVSGNATKYIGTLNFIIRFSCVTDGNIDYAWNTTIFKGITILEGIYNSDKVVEENYDILAQWKQELIAAGVDALTLDKTLMVEGEAADARAVGDKINELLKSMDELSKKVGSLPEGNFLMTADKVNALDGMFKVAAYDKTKDYAGAYATFKQVFGIVDSDDGTENEGEHIHNYTSSVTTAATCTTAGVRTYVCSCGNSYTEEISATGHNYVNGVCSVCGVADPNVETEVTLLSISAAYVGGDVAVGTALSDLTDITVTANYSDASAEIVTDYTLSGEIVDGESVITVSYGGKTTTFTVIGFGGADPIYTLETASNVSLPDRYGAWPIEYSVSNGNHVEINSGDEASNSLYMDVNFSSAATNGIALESVSEWFKIPAGAEIIFKLANVKFTSSNNQLPPNMHFGLRETGASKTSMAYVVEVKASENIINGLNYTVNETWEKTVTIESETSISGICGDFSAKINGVGIVLQFDVMLYVNGERWI